MRLMSERKRDLHSSKTFAIEMHTYKLSQLRVDMYFHGHVFSLILL